ncbi:PREDICTED: connector enhancer of kinase suppressor of ras 1 [Calidris pugnax]|uniref:connector enhancer of kinase suppressor of ras 1 n=1 Tax=Calidris pugnax TaxID=198806 RepID=UPI00071C79D9|nr:PREDICTED: connector enhancer of kinase suppressor of ras 1 [Calidris pugnax]
MAPTGSSRIKPWGAAPADSGLASTSLRTLTERLQELAQDIQGLVLGGPPAEAAPRPPPLALLARVVDLVGAAKGLFSWLNRYLFSTLNDFSASRDIVLLCAQLAETLQEDCPPAERDSQILQICQHIVGICENIVGCSPPTLLDRRAVLQRVGLVLPPSPRGSPPSSPDTLALPSGLGDVGAVAGELCRTQEPWLGRSVGSAAREDVGDAGAVGLGSRGAVWGRGHGSPGDVQVVNLAKKLLEKASGVTLVLKKIPLDLPRSPPSPRQQLPGAVVDIGDPPGSRRGECPGSPVSLTSRGAGSAAAAYMTLLLSRNGKACAEPATGKTEGAPSESGAGRTPTVGPPSPATPTAVGGCCFGSGLPSPHSAAADLDSGPDSAPDPVTDEEDGGDERDSELPGCGPSEEEAAWEGETPLGTPPSPGVPAVTGPYVSELSPTAAPATGAGGAEPGQVPEEGSPRTGRRPKGVATRLSRRRVSCRDLGRVDCDGWLLKKKDHVGFMAQKWKRCWFVLKGHTLYWYNHPNDEKAAGLINVATYDLESTREQKKKYVFQLSHQRYKPFVFAAETLADLSMWVSHLLTAKKKYALAHQSVPDREEDCYSETEAEDPDDESPRHGCDSPKKRLQNAPERAQLFMASGESSSTASSPQGSPRPCSPVEPAGEDLECLMRCLKQGGVSLIGRQRFLTQEQCRKSFIRRNKNPHINEKVHVVRALQSTLKAKVEELQALEQLLSDAALTSEKFTRWKEEHQELYQELREWWARQEGQDPHGGLGAEHVPPEEAAEP